MACGTESATSPVPPVALQETLARAVTSGDDAKQWRRGDFPASTFTQENEQELSVDRFGKMTPDDAVKQGHITATRRGEGRRFHGWALISVSSIQNVGLEAFRSPQAEHKWHADIALPPNAATNVMIHRQGAAKLARRAEWRVKPE
jgi:hypothetical protein